MLSLQKELYNSINLPVISLDKAGDFYLNDLALNVVNLTARSGNIKDTSSKIEGSAKQILQLMEGVIKNGDKHIQEVESGVHTYSISIKPIKDGSDIVGATAILINVSELKQTKQESTLIYQVTSTLVSSLPQEETLNIILNQIVTIMGIEGGNIMLIEPLTKKLITKISLGSVRKFPLELQIGEGIAGWVAKTGQPLAIPHTKLEKRYILGEKEKDQSLLSIPLITKNIIIGVLNLRQGAGEYFSESEMQTLYSIASRLATYLDNERLSEEMKNEKDLLDLVEKNTDKGLILHDSQGKIRFYNPAVKEILGLKKSILGNNWLEVLKKPGEYSDLDFLRPKAVIAEALDAMAKGEKVKIRLITRGEKRRIIIGKLKPINEKGQFENGALVTIEDVTALETVNEKLAERIDQLTQLFKISSLDSTDFEKTIKRIVKSLPTLMNTEKSLFSVYDPMSEKFTTVCTKGWGRLKKRADFNQSFCRRWIIEHEKALLVPQEKDYPENDVLLKKYNVETLLALPVFRHGRCLGVLAVANKNNGKKFIQEDVKLLSIVDTQIQAQLENQELLDKSEAEKERLESIIEHSADGMAALDPQDQVILWNSTLSELTGYSSSEVLNMSVDNVLVPREGGPITKIIRADLKKKGKRQESYHEIELKTKAGEYRWVSMRYSTSQRMAGKLVDTVVLIHDISRFKDLENAKNEFISMTAHELRTPLTAIKGYMSMIMQGDAGELNERQERYFGRAYKSTERLVTLTEEILNVMRLEEHRMTFQIQPISMKQATKEILLDFYQKASQKNIRLSLVNNISDREVSVMADFNRTKQILGNLVDNALKYTPKGGQVSVRLYPSKEKDKKFVATEITDSGVGIDNEQLASIFSKFHRVNNLLSKQAGGYGLGLFITKSLIEQQGGKIWVESKLGQGSKFTFILPVTNKKEKIIIKQEVV